jgi:hypothetical protein
LVGAIFIVRIERIVVVCGCAVTTAGVPRFAGVGKFVVTVTTVMGADFVTEDVTIRIGSAATSGAAKRRVKMLKSTRRDLSQWCNN